MEQQQNIRISSDLEVQESQKDRTGVSSAFDYLPNEIIENVFSYLPLEERCKIGRVCSRWYHLSRSPVFWRTVILDGISPRQMIKVIPYLPDSVQHLQLHPAEKVLPMCVFKILAKIYERCPKLKTLIIDQAIFIKNIWKLERDNLLEFQSHMGPFLDLAKRSLNDDDIQFYQSEYCNEVSEMHLSTDLPELQVLSLRGTNFNPASLNAHLNNSALPKLSILDFTGSATVQSHYILNMDIMVNLIELYLAKCDIEHNDIGSIVKYATKLKVLDLECTKTSDFTFSSIKEFGYSLEKLYLSSTSVIKLNMTTEDEGCLPCLNTICLRSTRVITNGIKNILKICRSLTCVDVMRTSVTEISLQDIPDMEKMKVRFSKLDDYLLHRPPAHCDHFKKNHYHNS